MHTPGGVTVTVADTARRMALKRRYALIFGILLFSSAAAGWLYAAETPEELDAHNVRVKVHPRTGNLRLLGARRDAPITIPGAAPAVLPEDAGRAAVRSFGPLFGLTQPDQQTKLIKDTIKSRGGSRHRYRQVHEGVPVLAGELLINLDDTRRLTSMTGEVSQVLTLTTRPDLSRARARRTALRAMAKWYALPDREFKTSVPELWIVDPKLLAPSDRESRLTWRIEVTDKTTPHAIRELLFVDATTGGITLRVNLIESAKNRETYTANNTSSLPGTLVCNESDPTCAAGDADAVAAHNYAGDTYDFYFTEHDRDSLDDAGQTMISTVHYNSFICPNAFWDGNQMVYCNGFSLADDVVGHELTHGVTEHSSNLFYYYQSGAINESFSDLWGEFVDLINVSGDDSAGVRWLIGEDLPLSVGVLRDMADPTLYSDPDKMSSPWYHTSSSDNGGVHTNSGINNKAAYLMTDGGVFNGYVVNGLGIAKVADIYYEAQTNLLSSGADYTDLYDALYQACLNLVGIDGITLADCNEVQNATDAVEMNTDPQGFTPEAAVCPVGQSASALFFDDIENGTVNWVFNTLSGSPGPVWVLDSGYTASGEYSLWGKDTFGSTDAVAEMNVDVALPAGETAYLHFKHSFGFERGQAPDPGTYWDGGWLDYSIDGGGNWIDAGSLIDDGQAYTGTIYNNPANPNVGHTIFGDESHGYVSTRLDLGALAGQNIRFRWRISTDGYVSGPLGWQLDDVWVYTCGNANGAPLINDATVPNLDEHSASGTGVYDVNDANTGNDADVDGDPISYAITDGNTGGAFAIDATTGAITVASSAALDFETNPVFNLEVTATAGSLNDTAFISVNLIDANEAPQIQSITASPSTINDAMTSNLTVVATDTDGPQSLTYSWSVNPGEGTIVNPNSANATYIPPNVVTGQTFTISVQVSDGADISNASVEITVQDTGGDMSMIIDIPDSGGYGNGFGSDENETVLTAVFENTGVNLELSVNGYDIDYVGEVAVSLNGSFMGFLTAGPDNGLTAGDTFYIPVLQQIPGTNNIEFREQIAGYKWGIKDLLLSTYQNDAVLIPDVADSGTYGNYGNNPYKSSVFFVFEYTAVDMELSVNGFDIDYVGEVAIYLNGTLVGYLSAGPNGELTTGDTIFIPASQQIPNTNVIEFRVQTAGFTWGVQDLLLSTFQNDVALVPDDADGGAYGNYGHNPYKSSVIAIFENTGVDMQLSVNGFDIDYTGEVAVYLNGTFVAHLSMGPNGGLTTGDTFFIPATQQISGSNVIEFRVSVSGYTWGVQDLLLSTYQNDVVLVPDVLDSGAYGNYGNNPYKATVIAVFENTGVDMELWVNGYDIDFAGEVAVYLNNVLQGYLSIGPNDDLNAGDVFVIPVLQQTPGTNVIEFREQTTGYTWGVQDLLLSTF